MATGQRVYGVYDRKAATLIGPLQCFVTDAPANRMFADTVAQVEMFNKHPEDFCLMLLGHLDLEEPQLVGTEPEIILEALTITTLQQQG